MHSKNWVTTLWCVLASGACTSDVETISSETQLRFEALLEAPDEAAPDLFVVWSVNSPTAADYSYTWGHAEVGSLRFALRLDERPPTEAINAFGVGVGLLVALPAGRAPADGKLDEDALVPQITGFSYRHAIIYADAAQRADWRAGLDAADLAEFGDHWLFDFPAGYSCAEGVDAPAGEVFDTFTASDCSRTRISWGPFDSKKVVNWF